MSALQSFAAAISAERPEPLWLQAAALISEQIARGELAQGARLPSERELCHGLGISRVTLRKALGRLVEDGLLLPSHGRGWYVAQGPSPKEWPNSLESFSETARRMGLESSSRVLCSVRRPATFDEAESLQIAPGALIFQLERVRCLDTMPVAVDSTEIPVDQVVGLDSVDFSSASLYDELAGRGSHRPVPTRPSRRSRWTPTSLGSWTSRRTSRSS
ncbi:hypothetical protein GCM10025864_12600 [Luteimicrobium album]|uniref:HTH gntR-type domain-containing protein n=1 Tax=Luteimicrobium album TaxID=1054550 RepID=A0ABQ6HYB7_9MICO|nr:hypothetical protein GCM10025864_12600 [Luteimicrobium album]